MAKKATLDAVRGQHSEPKHTCAPQDQGFSLRRLIVHFNHQLSPVTDPMGPNATVCVRPRAMDFDARQNGKRMNDFRRSPRNQKIPNDRPKDVGVEVALNLIVRTLRCHGLHHGLSGCPCVIGFILSNPADGETFVRASRFILQNRSRMKFHVRTETLHWESEGTVRRTRDTELAVRLATSDHVFGFATDIDGFPSQFRLVADGLVRLPPFNLSTLKASLRALGMRSLPNDVLEKVIGEPLSLLSALIKPGRSTPHIVQSLTAIRKEDLTERQPKPLPKKPSLGDLHGLGDAAVWGYELAKDLIEYQAGKLSWADVDRGVLVSGPTGTGKTTFAQALAETCNIPIHIHSLARWQAKGYLNDLLKAMRGAFRDAILDAPCILFIDELDSFGDRDLLNGKNENYEREVINALLECLDGVDGREGVVVVGATNMPDKIDKAILRPGRLGKHIQIPLPDADARLGILQHHLGQDVVIANLADIAVRLEGASGAVIEQVVRDARRNARSESRPLNIADLERTLPPRIMQSDQAYHLSCVHEAGHIVVGHFLGSQAGRGFIEAKVFREATHDGTGGWTIFHQIPSVNRGKAAYLAQITILLAGIAAEEVVFGERSGGAGGDEDSDLRHATLIATAMEVSLGLGESLVYLSSARLPANALSRLLSDPFLRRQVSGVLDACLQKSKKLIVEHSDLFGPVVQMLQDRGHITASDI
jgi:DNA polymerase III delta prime subunit